MTPKTKDKLADLREAAEAATRVCSTCGGVGWWRTNGTGPSYVNSVRDADGNLWHKTACEDCGGGFDNPGSGEIEDRDETTLALLSIIELQREAMKAALAEDDIELSEIILKGILARAQKIIEGIQ